MATRDSVVSAAVTSDVAGAVLDREPDRLGGLEVVLGHGSSRVCGTAGPAGAGPVGCGWWAVGGSDPAGHAAVAPPLAEASKPSGNGMLDRSMSTSTAESRVAARTTLTSQVLRLSPARAAFSSARVLTDSGIRSVTRASPPSSVSSGSGRGRRRGRRRCGRRGDVDDEVELAAVEAYVDAAVGQLGGDLGGGLGDRLHQGEPGRRGQGEDEALGGLLDVVAPGLGSGDEVLAEALDVRRDVHAHHYDITHDVMARPMTRDVSSACRGAAWSTGRPDGPDASSERSEVSTQRVRGSRQLTVMAETLIDANAVDYADPRDLLRASSSASGSWPGARSPTRSTSSSRAGRCRPG